MLHGCFYETNVIGCHGAERVTFERLLEREKLQAECTAAVAEAGHDLYICASSLVSHAQKGMKQVGLWEMACFPWLLLFQPRN